MVTTPIESRVLRQPREVEGEKSSMRVHSREAREGEAETLQGTGAQVEEVQHAKREKGEGVHASRFVVLDRKFRYVTDVYGGFGPGRAGGTGRGTWTGRPRGRPWGTTRANLGWGRGRGGGGGKGGGRGRGRQVTSGEEDSDDEAINNEEEGFPSEAEEEGSSDEREGSKGGSEERSGPGTNRGTGRTSQSEVGVEAEMLTVGKAKEMEREREGGKGLNAGNGEEMGQKGAEGGRTEEPMKQDGSAAGEKKAGKHGIGNEKDVNEKIHGTETMGKDLHGAVERESWKGEGEGALGSIPEGKATGLPQENGSLQAAASAVATEEGSSRLALGSNGKTTEAVLQQGGEEAGRTAGKQAGRGTSEGLEGREEGVESMEASSELRGTERVAGDSLKQETAAINDKRLEHAEVERVNVVELAVGTNAMRSCERPVSAAREGTVRLGDEIDGRGRGDVAREQAVGAEPAREGRARGAAPGVDAVRPSEEVLRAEENGKEGETGHAVGATEEGKGQEGGISHEEEISNEQWPRSEGEDMHEDGFEGSVESGGHEGEEGEQDHLEDEEERVEMRKAADLLGGLPHVVERRAEEKERTGTVSRAGRHVRVPRWDEVFEGTGSGGGKSNKGKGKRGGGQGERGRGRGRKESERKRARSELKEGDEEQEEGAEAAEEKEAVQKDPFQWRGASQDERRGPAEQASDISFSQMERERHWREHVLDDGTSRLVVPAEVDKGVKEGAEESESVPLASNTSEGHEDRGQLEVSPTKRKCTFPVIAKRFKSVTGLLEETAGEEEERGGDETREDEPALERGEGGSARMAPPPSDGKSKETAAEGGVSSASPSADEVPSGNTEPSPDSPNKGKGGRKKRKARKKKEPKIQPSPHLTAKTLMPRHPVAPSGYVPYPPGLLVPGMRFHYLPPVPGSQEGQGPISSGVEAMYPPGTPVYFMGALVQQGHGTHHMVPTWPTPGMSGSAGFEFPRAAGGTSTAATASLGFAVGPSMLGLSASDARAASGLAAPRAGFAGVGDLNASPIAAGASAAPDASLGEVFEVKPDISAPYLAGYTTGGAAAGIPPFHAAVNTQHETRNKHPEIALPMKQARHRGGASISSLASGIFGNGNAFPNPPERERAPETGSTLLGSQKNLSASNPHQPQRQQPSSAAHPAVPVSLSWAPHGVAAEQPAPSLRHARFRSTPQLDPTSVLTGRSRLPKAAEMPQKQRNKALDGKELSLGTPGVPARAAGRGEGQAGQRKGGGTATPSALATATPGPSLAPGQTGTGQRLQQEELAGMPAAGPAVDRDEDRLTRQGGNRSAVGTPDADRGRGPSLSGGVGARGADIAAGEHRHQQCQGGVSPSGISTPSGQMPSVGQDSDLSRIVLAQQELLKKLMSLIPGGKALEDVSSRLAALQQGMPEAVRVSGGAGTPQAWDGEVQGVDREGEGQVPSAAAVGLLQSHELFRSLVREGQEVGALAFGSEEAQPQQPQARSAVPPGALHVDSTSEAAGLATQAQASPIKTHSHTTGQRTRDPKECEGTKKNPRKAKKPNRTVQVMAGSVGGTAAMLDLNTIDSETPVPSQSWEGY